MAIPILQLQYPGAWIVLGSGGARRIPDGYDQKKAMSSEGVIQKPFKLPTTVDPTSINIYEAYKRGDTFYVEELGGEALASHYKFMRTLPVVGEVLDGIINAGFPLPTFQIFHCAYFSHGCCRSLLSQ